jgi:hypothetical protein
MPKWIQGAVSKKNKGAFTRYAKKKHESMGKAVQTGLHSKNATTRHRALFAKNMRALAKRKK